MSHTSGQLKKHYDLYKIYILTNILFDSFIIFRNFGVNIRLVGKIQVSVGNRNAIHCFIEYYNDISLYDSLGIEFYEPLFIEYYWTTSFDECDVVFTIVLIPTTIGFYRKMNNYSIDTKQTIYYYLEDN